MTTRAPLTSAFERGDASLYASDEYQAALNRVSYPELARRFVAYATTCARPAEIGEAFLNAAWVCDDTGLVKHAVEGRSRAAECFERCKPFEDSDEGLAMAAVLVDVLRRAGRLADGARVRRPAGPAGSDRCPASGAAISGAPHRAG